MISPKLIGMNRVQNLVDFEKYKLSEDSITLLNFSMTKNEHYTQHANIRGQLLYIKSGSLIVIANKHSYVIYPYYGIWIPAYVKYTILSLQQLKLYSLPISVENCKQLSNEPFIILASPFIQELFDRYYTQSSVPLKNESVKSIFLLLLHEIKESDNIPINLPLPQNKYLISICNQLLKEPLMGNSITELITNIPMSYRHAIRLFKKQTNIPFVRWRLRLKMHIAVMLLMTGYSVSWISYEVGYKNISSFSMAFKNEIGVTPKQLSIKKNL